MGKDSSDFDIRTLLNYQPPTYLCERCYAIQFKAPYEFKTHKAQCPICKVEYVPDEFEFKRASDVGRYLKSQGLDIQFADPFDHAKRLAGIVRRFERSLDSQNDTPLHHVLSALNAATQFVHFTTWGMDMVMIGVIKLLANRIPVRGIVSNATENVVQELAAAINEAPRLRVQVHERGERFVDQPHTKLIIVDGLLMFCGSTNFTSNAWRTVRKGHNQVSVNTKVDEIAEQNNRYVSKVLVADLPCEPIEMTRIRW